MLSLCLGLGLALLGVGARAQREADTHHRANSTVAVERYRSGEVAFTPPPSFSTLIKYDGSVLVTRLIPDGRGGAWAVIAGEGVSTFRSLTFNPSYDTFLGVVRYRSDWIEANYHLIDFGPTGFSAARDVWHGIESDRAGGVWLVGTLYRTANFGGADVSASATAPVCYAARFAPTGAHISSGAIRGNDGATYCTGAAGVAVGDDTNPSVTGAGAGVVVVGHTSAASYRFGRSSSWTTGDTVDTGADPFIVTVSSKTFTLGTQGGIDLVRSEAWHGGAGSSAKFLSVTPLCRDPLGGVKEATYLVLGTADAGATIAFGTLWGTMQGPATFLLQLAPRMRTVVLVLETETYPSFEVVRVRNFVEAYAERGELAMTLGGDVWSCLMVTAPAAPPGASSQTSFDTIDFNESHDPTLAVRSEWYVRHRTTSTPTAEALTGEAMLRVPLPGAVVPLHGWRGCAAAHDGGLFVAGTVAKDAHSRGGVPIPLGVGKSRQMLMRVTADASVVSVHLYEDPSFTLGAATFTGIAAFRPRKMVAYGSSSAGTFSYIAVPSPPPTATVGPSLTGVVVSFDSGEGEDIPFDGVRGCPVAVPTDLRVLPSSEILGAVVHDGAGGYFAISAGAATKSYMGIPLASKDVAPTQIIVARFDGMARGMSVRAFPITMVGDFVFKRAVSDREGGVWVLGSLPSATAGVMVERGGTFVLGKGNVNMLLLRLSRDCEVLAHRVVGRAGESYFPYFATESLGRGGVMVGLSTTRRTVDVDGVVLSPDPVAGGQTGALLIFGSTGEVVGGYGATSTNNVVFHAAVGVTATTKHSVVSVVSVAATAPVAFLPSFPLLKSNTGGPWFVRAVEKGGGVVVTQVVRIGDNGPATLFGAGGGPMGGQSFISFDAPNPSLVLCTRVTATLTVGGVMKADTTNNEVYMRVDPSSLAITNSRSFASSGSNLVRCVSGSVGFRAGTAYNGGDAGGFWSYTTMSSSHARGTGVSARPSAGAVVQLTHMQPSLDIDFETTFTSAGGVGDVAATALGVSNGCRVTLGLATGGTAEVSLALNKVGGVVPAGSMAVIEMDHDLMCTPTAHTPQAESTYPLTVGFSLSTSFYIAAAEDGGVWVACSLGPGSTTFLGLPVPSDPMLSQRLLIARLDATFGNAQLLIAVLHDTPISADWVMTPDGSGGVWLHVLDLPSNVRLNSTTTLSGVSGVGMFRWNRKGHVLVGESFPHTSTFVRLHVTRSTSAGVVVGIVPKTAAAFSFGDMMVGKAASAAAESVLLLAVDEFGVVTADAFFSGEGSMKVMMDVVVDCSRAESAACSVVLMLAVHDAAVGEKLTVSRSGFGAANDEMILLRLDGGLEVMRSERFGMLSTASTAAMRADGRGRVWVRVSSPTAVTYTSARGEAATAPKLTAVSLVDVSSLTQVGPVVFFDHVARAAMDVDSGGGLVSWIYSVPGTAPGPRETKTWGVGLPEKRIGVPYGVSSRWESVVRVSQSSLAGPTGVDIVRSFPMGSPGDESASLRGFAVLFTSRNAMVLTFDAKGLTPVMQVTGPTGSTTGLGPAVYFTHAPMFPASARLPPAAAPPWPVTPIAVTHPGLSPRTPQPRSFFYFTTTSTPQETAPPVSRVYHGITYSMIGSYATIIERRNEAGEVVCHLVAQVEFGSFSAMETHPQDDGTVWLTLSGSAFTAGSVKVVLGSATQPTISATTLNGVLHVGTGCEVLNYKMVPVSGVSVEGVAPHPDGSAVMLVESSVPVVRVDGTTLDFGSITTRYGLLRLNPAGSVDAALPILMLSGSMYVYNLMYEAVSNRVYVAIEPQQATAINFNFPAGPFLCDVGVVVVRVHPETLVVEAADQVAARVGVDGWLNEIDIIPRPTGGGYVVFTASFEAKIGNHTFIKQHQYYDLLVAAFTSTLQVESAERVYVDTWSAEFQLPSRARATLDGIYVPAVVRVASGAVTLGPLRSQRHGQTIGLSALGSEVTRFAPTVLFFSDADMRVAYVAPFAERSGLFPTKEDRHFEVRSVEPLLGDGCGVVFHVRTTSRPLLLGDFYISHGGLVTPPTAPPKQAGMVDAVVLLEEAACTPRPYVRPQEFTKTPACGKSTVMIIDQGGAAESHESGDWDWGVVVPKKRLVAFKACTPSTHTITPVPISALTEGGLYRWYLQPKTPSSLPKISCAGVAAEGMFVAVANGGSVKLYRSYETVDGSMYMHVSGYSDFHVSSSALTVVAMSGRVLAVGVPEDASGKPYGTADIHDRSSSGSGAVHVYERLDSATMPDNVNPFAHVAYLKPPVAFAADSQFGSAVSVSGDGRVIAVGMPGDARDEFPMDGWVDVVAPPAAPLTAPRSGAVVFFSRMGYTGTGFEAGNGWWTATGMIKEPAGAAGRACGSQVAVDGAWPSYEVAFTCVGISLADAAAGWTVYSVAVTVDAFARSGSVLRALSSISISAPTHAPTASAAFGTALSLRMFAVDKYALAVGGASDDRCGEGVISAATAGSSDTSCIGHGAVWVLFMDKGLGETSWAHTMTYRGPAGTFAVGMPLGLGSSVSIVLSGTLFSVAVGAARDHGSNVGRFGAGGYTAGTDSNGGAVFVVSLTSASPYTWGEVGGFRGPIGGALRVGRSVAGTVVPTVGTVASHVRLFSCAAGLDGGGGVEDPPDGSVGFVRGLLLSVARPEALAAPPSPGGGEPGDDS